MKKLGRVCAETLCAALRFPYDSRADTAVEHALIVGLIALAIVEVLTLIGSNIGNTLNTAGNSTG